MTLDHADTALDGFTEVETRFRDFLRAVPATSEHAKVHSPLLASILLDACSLIETVLKSTMDNQRYDTRPNIAQHRSRRYTTSSPYLNINDLRQVFRPDQFYAKPTWLLARGDRSFPWYAWQKSAVKHPSWWTAYNKVKHNRFDNAKRATLGMTMHAMKALFLSIIQSLEFRGRLVERGVIRCHEANSIHGLANVASQWEPLPTDWSTPVIGVSSLFGYKFLSTGMPAHATEVSVFL